MKKKYKNKQSKPDETKQPEYPAKKAKKAKKVNHNCKECGRYKITIRKSWCCPACGTINKG